MARRKRSRKYSRRRSRVGAMGKSTITNVIGIAAGAAAGRIVSQKLLPNVNATMKSAGTIVLGMFFPKLIKGNFGTSMGAGMIAAGSLGVLQGTGVLGAIDDAIDGMPMVGMTDVGAIDYEIGEVDEIGEIDESMGAMDDDM